MKAACYFDADQGTLPWLSVSATGTNTTTFSYPLNFLPGQFQPTGISEKVSNIFGDLNINISTNSINRGESPNQNIENDHFARESKNEQNFVAFLVLCIATVIAAKYLVTAISYALNKITKDPTDKYKTEGNIIAVVAHNLKKVEQPLINEELGEV